MTPRTKLRCAGASHPGLVRENNEDRVYCDADRGIFLVIDGIGGHAAGEKAADTALVMVRSRLERETGSAEERIREAITVANNEIFRLARTNPEWHGMACVLTVALVEDGSAVVGHVGDSRLYKIRGGGIQKITHDHSPVGEREDARALSEAEAMRHPRRNEVYRDVGTEEHAPDDPEFIEIIPIAFEEDSALLICSDGLSDQVTSAEILHTVAEAAGSPDTAVDRLIAAANRAGGKDNVSAVVVEGPLFAARSGLAAAKEAGYPRRGPFSGRVAMMLYGVLVGLLLMAGLERRFGWFISGTGSATAGPRVLAVGAAGEPFSSIADALAQARAGDTIELAGGEYREQVRLRDGIRLTSRVPNTAIIRAAPAYTGPSIAIVADKVKNCRITGLRILADTKLPLDAGILLDNSDIEIADSEIAGARTGVMIRGNSGGTIQASSIHDNLESGIAISGAATPRLLHNDIARNGRSGREPGILVSGEARPVMIGNIFTENSGPAVEIPAGIDGAPILKFNYFLKGDAIGHTGDERRGSSPRRRRP